MLVLSYILLIPISYGPTMQVKCLEIWLQWILRSWRFGTLEVSEGAFCCYKYLLVFIFAWMYIWCKNMWFEFLECWEVYLRCLKVCRLQAFDFNVFSVQGFIWELWRCLDLNNTLLEKFGGVYSLKHLTWIFWKFENLFENYEGV